MRIDRSVRCVEFPCTGVEHELYIVPGAEVVPDDIWLVMISEAAAPDPADYYYAGGAPLFEQTTVQAFRDAGAEVDSVSDLLEMGVYLTTAVKCGKTGYGIKAAPIHECSFLLEQELAFFPDVRVLMLMGDVAIKSLNYIAKRSGGQRVIPVGSTYKIRGEAYYHGRIRVYPSYLQAGPSFFIEKGKRKMIAEDIADALRLAPEDC
jgi:uracil-DNA glycosylase